MWCCDSLLYAINMVKDGIASCCVEGGAKNRAFV